MDTGVAFDRMGLIQVASSARETALALLKKEMDSCGDESVRVIAPDEGAANWLCDLEEAAWFEELRLLKGNVLFWAVASVPLLVALGLAISALLFTTSLVAKGFCFAAAVATTLLLVKVASFGVEDSSDLRAAYVRRRARGASGPLINHGRSVWMLSDRGLYVAHNRRELGEVSVSFHSFEGLRAPTVAAAHDRSLIQLFTKTGNLVRVMIFPNTMQTSAKAAVDLITQAIHASERRSLRD